MKLKNLKYLFVLSFLVPLFGCNNNAPKEKSDTTLINGFENLNDMYKAKLLYSYSAHGIDCAFNINHDSKYIHDGSGSLKMEMNQPSDNTGKYSYFYQPIELSGLEDRDLSDLDKFGIWLYNDNNVSTTISMAIISTDKMAINVDDKIELPSKEWKYAELNISKLVAKNSYSNFIGFGFLIDKISGTFYADNWTVKFGATETEEDLKYKTLIEEVSNGIPLLPDESSPEYPNALRSLAGKYYSIKSGFRSAVANYRTLEKKCASYIELLNSKIESGDTVYHLNDPIGMSQASIDFSSIGLDLFFSSEEKAEPEDFGSMKVSSALTSGWAYVKVSTNSISFSKFDSITFKVKNTLDKPIALCISWNQSAVNIPANSSWTDITLPTTLLGSTIEIEFCGNKYGVGGNEETVGDVYFSSFIVN